MSAAYEEKQFDIVVVGGGIGGVCAAIAAARHGAKTALVQNRPVLGGNASSEIRVNIEGAAVHASRKDAREGGILEEILLENHRRNPQHSFSVFDTVLWEKVHFQENLTLFLNTHMDDAALADGRIAVVMAKQLTSERRLRFAADIFIDCTGDGSLAALVGADYMVGREGKDVFGEEHAPDVSDPCTMGSTLYFQSCDMGQPTPFVKPEWAHTFTNEQMLEHDEMSAGYWWVEIGGGEWDTIRDAEAIRDELLKTVYGIWDHIKNSGHHAAENLALQWIGMLPGKRESRRITGAYVLKEQDVLAGRVFEDAVAYGGWYIDPHMIELAMSLRRGVPYSDAGYIHLDGLYTIPYGCLYSRNVPNLMMGGRLISASRQAFSSARVMGTCAVVSQAAGTAAAMAVRKGLLPADIAGQVGALQQALLKDDCFIPGFVNTDALDLARTAQAAASSETAEGACVQLTRGCSRGQENAWISREQEGLPAWAELSWDAPVAMREVRLVFDSDFSVEMVTSMSKGMQRKQRKGLPPTLVKDYTIAWFNGEACVAQREIVENGQRLRVHRLDETIAADRVRLTVIGTYGEPCARVFEMRVYEA